MRVDIPEIVYRYTYTICMDWIPLCGTLLLDLTRIYTEETSSDSFENTILRYSFFYI